VDILGALDTARTTKTAEYYGVLGEPVFVVGTDAAMWRYVIYQTGQILVGMVDAGMAVGAFKGVGMPHNIAAAVGLAGAIFTDLFSVKDGDVIQFELDAGGVVHIGQETTDGSVVRQEQHNLAQLGYEGRPVKFGLSSVPGTTMSVKLMKDVAFSITAQQDGKSVMHATVHDIVDFGVRDIYLNDPDAPPPSGGGDRIENLVSGAYVRCYADGTVGVQGGVNYGATIGINDGANAFTLTRAMHFVDIGDIKVHTVKVPDSSAGREFVVHRTYAAQPGEVWNAPVMQLELQGAADTFSGGGKTLGVTALSTARITKSALGDLWFVG
jgi:hypothetical protein